MSCSLVTFVAAADDEARSQQVAAVVPIDKPKRREGPEVAVDGRGRRVEEDGQLLGADLAAIGDGQEDAQAAGERRVLAGLLGRPVAGCRRRAHRTDAPG